jgi:DNA-nicking Smr family endonuclease
MTRRRAATEAEKLLWSAAMQGVRKLAPPNPPAELSEPEELLPVAPVKIISKSEPAKPKLRASGSVDGATLDRLRRGQVAIDSRIDLHGLDQRQAFDSLMGFIDISARAGKRCLLIITGKGSMGPGGGILRRNVPLWMTSSHIAGRILTIAPAHPRHGGDGAFYVLLRRAPRR